MAFHLHLHLQKEKDPRLLRNLPPEGAVALVPSGCTTPALGGRSGAKPH